MKQKIIPIIVCPKCKSFLKLEVDDSSKHRIHQGKLLCTQCDARFKIIDDVVCFRPIKKRGCDKKRLRKTKNLFLRQEFRKEWQKHFSREEFLAVKDEWNWIIDSLNLKKSKIHLDWATGTGRFLRNILKVAKGELIALEIDYATCLGLKAFLKKIGKYSKVTIINGDARNMPFANNSIDSISSWHGLDEPNINKAIDESKRALKRNKALSTGGLFYEKSSKSFKIAKKSKINFASENKASQYFKKLGFKDIHYKAFFKAKWIDRKSFLPKFGDYYTTYVISGKK